MKNLILQPNFRRSIAIASFFFFAVWQIIFIAHYEGYYAFDEMYHISSSNIYFHFSSKYDRAPYINESIHLLSSLFGSSYYVFKIIPYILSLLSTGLLLYLIYHLTNHISCIILFTLLVSTHSLILFNHIYIRMYIWDEAIIALLAVVLYHISHTKLFYKHLLLIVFYIFLCFFLYAFHPTEESSLAILATGLAALLLNYILKYFLPFLKENHLLFFSILLFLFILILIELLIIALRKELIPIPTFLSSFLKDNIIYVGNLDSPDFTLYYLKQGILFPIALIAYGYIILNSNYENNIIGIYLLGFIPFLFFNMLFFDEKFSRVFASYLPILVLIICLWFDHFPEKPLFQILMGFAVIITALASYRNGIAEFYNVPYIQAETELNDYGSMVSLAKKEIKNGRKCICIWANTHNEASFNLATELSIPLQDSRNHPYNYSKEYFSDILDFLETTNEPYILITATHTDWKIDAINPDFLPTLFEKYPYICFEPIRANAFMFFIN